jgi:plastocyanin domain-containing protein
MTRALLLTLSLLTVSCTKDGEHPTPKTAPVEVSPAVGQRSPDGIRHVAIEANKDGYTPAKIDGKPGEKLVLVFTRTADSSCISQLKAPDGNMVDLPMNKPVEVAVTVPQTGEVGFACGMDMFHGVVVAQPSS